MLSIFFYFLLKFNSRLELRFFDLITVVNTYLMSFMVFFWEKKIIPQ